MARGNTSEQAAPAGFDLAALEALNATLSRADGIDISELLALIEEHFRRSRSRADLRAFREGRKPWKKLADEVVPVAAFLRQAGVKGTVRFPLDDQPPDAWLQKAGAPGWVGIEVTRVLARAKVELARDLRNQPFGRGFLGFADDTSQRAFDQARARRRVTNSRQGVEKAIEESALQRLAGKADSKYEGQTLLMLAPLGSAPAHDWTALRDRLAAQARKTSFAEVILMDEARPSQRPISILDGPLD